MLSFWLEPTSDGESLQHRHPALQALYHSFVGLVTLFLMLLLLDSRYDCETGTIWLGLLVGSLSMLVRASLWSRALFERACEQPGYRSMSVALAPYLGESGSLCFIIFVGTFFEPNGLFTQNGTVYAGWLAAFLAAISVLLAPVCGVAVGVRMACSRDGRRLLQKAAVGVAIWLASVPFFLSLQRALPYSLRRTLAFPILPVLVAVLCGLALIRYCLGAPKADSVAVPCEDTRAILWTSTFTGLALPHLFAGEFASFDVILCGLVSGYLFGLVLELLYNSIPGKDSGLLREQTPQSHSGMLAWMMLAGGLSGLGCSLGLTLASILELTYAGGLSFNDGAMLGVSFGFLGWLGWTVWRGVRPQRGGVKAAF